MKIEKLLLKKHLKAGAKEYPMGEYPNPVYTVIPDDILAESHRRDVVEIIEMSQPPLPPVSSVQEVEKASVWKKQEPEVKEEPLVVQPTVRPKRAKRS